jgi:hypothetical protein
MRAAASHSQKPEKKTNPAHHTGSTHHSPDCVRWDAPHLPVATHGNPTRPHSGRDPCHNDLG